MVNSVDGKAHWYEVQVSRTDLIAGNGFPIKNFGNDSPEKLFSMASILRQEETR